MGKLIQFDFFKDPEICGLEADIDGIRRSTDRVRKKLFAENGKLKQVVEELTIRLDILERHICRGDS